LSRGEKLIISRAVKPGGHSVGEGFDAGSAIRGGKAFLRPPNGPVAESGSKAAMAGDDAARAARQTPRGTGWTKRAAGPEGEGPLFRFRTAGEDSGFFWSRVNMPSKNVAEGFFGKFRPGNLGNEAVTAYVKPGAPFWEHVGRGGVTELFVNPKDIFVVVIESVV
jgi:hypothetical protein